MGHLNSGQEGECQASCMHLYNLIRFLQLATTDMQTPINSMGGPEINRSTSAPPHSGEILQPHFVSFQSSSVSPVVASSQGAKGNPLRLGVNKSSSNIPIDSLVNEFAEDAAFTTTQDNPWGSDDLMDVNADNDDWSMLTSFSNSHRD